jgi:hypothetical protein
VVKAKVKAVVLVVLVAEVVKLKPVVEAVHQVQTLLRRHRN